MNDQTKTPQNVASWPRNSNISQPQKLARQLLEAYQILMDFFKGDADKTCAWMTTSNPMLGNAIPLNLFFRDRGHKVLAFMRTAIEENKGFEHG